MIKSRHEDADKRLSDFYPERITRAENAAAKAKTGSEKKDKRRASDAMGAQRSALTSVGRRVEGPRDDITPSQIIIPMVQARSYGYKLWLRNWYGRGPYSVEP